ncbi:MAG: hypothetical protein AB3N28_12065 [Kordiimonas sp.]
MASKESKENNSFLLLGKELAARLTGNARDVSYWVYILLTVLIFSGMGIWFELFSIWILSLNSENNSFNDMIFADPINLLIAFTTFFPAVSGASLSQLIIGIKDDKKYLRSASFFMLFIIFILCLVAFTLVKTNHFSSALVLNAIGCLCAVIIVWIANADSDQLSDKTNNADASVGGDVDAPLSSRSTDIKV